MLFLTIYPVPWKLKMLGSVNSHNLQTFRQLVFNQEKKEEDP